MVAVLIINKDKVKDKDNQVDSSVAGDWPSVTSASLPDLVDTAFAFLVCFDLFDTINLISFAFLFGRHY